MLTVLCTVAPLFITLGFGFAAGFLAKFRTIQAGLNTFTFYVGLPALLFSTISTAPATTGVSWLGLSIAAGLASSLSVTTYYVARLGRHRSRSPAPTALAPRSETSASPATRSQSAQSGPRQRFLQLCFTS